jgi:hypothetical protein
MLVFARGDKFFVAMKILATVVVVGGSDGGEIVDIGDGHCAGGKFVDVDNCYRG